MADIVFYPSLDGMVKHEESGLTWAQLRAAAGTLAVDSATALQAVVEADSTLDEFYGMGRVVILFDTSALSDGITITSATLTIRRRLVGGKIKWNHFTEKPALAVVVSNPISNSALVPADFSRFGTTLLSNKIEYDDYGANDTDVGYSVFTLTPAGIAAINLTGITKLGLREANFDIANSTPTWGRFSDCAFNCGSVETGGLYPPKLTITFGPAVTTQAVTEISGTTATGNGTVTSLGAPTATQHGHCWNTLGSPTTADSKTENGAPSAIGAFTSAMTSLTAGTKYYVRAYIINDAGTFYGSQVVFWADKGTVWPSEAITRVTNIIHRYVRATQAYTMEVNLGEVTSDFGLPEWAEKAMTAYVPDADKPTSAGEVDKAVYNPLRDYMNRPPPSSVMITRTSLTPPLTEPFTSLGATAAQMAAYAGMSQSDYNKIVRQAQVIKALQEFGPLIGPDDLAKLKAKYPGLGSDTGVPRGGTAQFTRWAVGISPVSIRGAQPAATVQYDADMRLLAKNAPYLLTPEELQKYG